MRGFGSDRERSRRRSLALYEFEMALLTQRHLGFRLRRGERPVPLPGR